MTGNPLRDPSPFPLRAERRGRNIAGGLSGVEQAGPLTVARDKDRHEWFTFRLTPLDSITIGRALWCHDPKVCDVCNVGSKV